MAGTEEWAQRSKSGGQGSVTPCRNRTEMSATRRIARQALSAQLPERVLSSLPLHVPHPVIADFTAAPMAPDELREGFRRTGQASAQKVGNRILPLLRHCRCRCCGLFGRDLPGGDFEPLPGGLAHGLFPHHQGADMGQPSIA